MERFLGAYAPYAYAVMRVVVGLLFACHGAQKLFGVLGGVDGRGASVPLFSLFGLAGIIELAAGSLIALGLMTGYAAFVASGEMAGAYFIAHAPRGFWPILNTGEVAVLYCFVFLYIASRGAGAWSIDGARGEPARAESPRAKAQGFPATGSRGF